MDGFYQIVYAAQHSAFAWRLLAQLSGQGVPLFFDQWMRQLSADTPTGYVIILSRAVLTDPVLTAEVAALDTSRPVFIVALEALPSLTLPSSLQHAAILSFSDWHDERRLTAQTERLAKAIERQYGTPFTPLPPELRYLTALIAELETDRPLLEFAPVGGEPAPHCAPDQRFQPPGAIVWGVNNRLLLRHDQPAIPTEAAIPAASLGETVAAVRRVCLTGEPGVGKSAVLKRLLLDLARHRFSEYINGNTTLTAPLPVLIDLAADPTEHAVTARVADHWRRWGLPGDPITALASGQALLALDGIDALGRNAAAQSALLRDWLAQPTAPQYLILTCEQGCTAALNPGLPLLECLPFDEAGAQRLLAALLTGDQAAALWRRLSDPAAGLPNVLWTHPAHLLTVIRLYQTDPAHDLPTSLGKLYRRYWEQLWHGHTAALALPKPELMQRLAAFALHQIDTDAPAALPRGAVLAALGSDAAAAALLDTAIALGVFTLTPAGGVRFSSRWLLAITAAHGFSVPDAIARLRRPVVQADGRRRAARCDDLLRLAVGISTTPELLLREIAEVDPLLAITAIGAGFRSGDGFGRIVRTIGEGLMELSCGQPPERSAAAQAAQRLGRPVAAAPLLSAARTGSWDDRAAALYRLSLQPLHIPAELLTAVRAWHWQTHPETAATLRELGELAVPALLRLLHDADWEVQRGAAWALGELGDPAAVVALVQRLTAPDPQVRLAVVQALAQFDEPALSGEFFRLLDDDTGYVRVAARTALRRYPQAVLERAHAALHVDSLSLTGRQELTRLLGVIGTIDPAAAHTLLLHHLEHSEPALRAAACAAAAETMLPEVVNKLGHLLEDTAPVLLDGEAQTVAEAAWAALQAINLPAARQVVRTRRRQLPSEREQIDQQEAQHDRWAQTQELLHRLTDPDPRWQRHALNNLDRYDDSRIVPYLVEAAASADPHISRLAVKGLQKYVLTGTAQHGLAAALRRPHTSDLAADLLVGAGTVSIPTLLAALTTADPIVISTAIGALARLIEQGHVSGDALTEVQHALLAHAENTTALSYSGETVGDYARAALEVLTRQQRRLEAPAISPALSPTDDAQPLQKTDKMPVMFTDAELMPDTPSEIPPESLSAYPADWPELPNLLALLTDANDEVREQGRYQLLQGAKQRAADDRAAAEWVTTLIAALASPHEAVLRAVVTVFGRWTTARAAPALAQLLQHPDAGVRGQALAALRDCHDPAVLTLTLPLLADPDWLVRYTACDFVRQHGADLIAAALPAFKRLLTSHADHECWPIIIRAIGRLPGIDDETLGLLLHHVSTRNPHVRVALIRTFDRLQYPAGEALAAYLDDVRPAPQPSTSDRPATIAELTAVMLTRLNTPGSLAAVRQWQAASGIPTGGSAGS